MTWIYAVLLLTGITGILAALCALAVRVDKKRDENARKRQNEGNGFDERQVTAQGRASNFCNLISAFYYGGVTFYLMVYGMSSKAWAYPVDPAILVFGGLILQAVARQLYCAMTDAVLPLRGYVRTGTGYLLGGGLLMITGIMEACMHGLPLTGKHCDCWISLIFSVGFIVMGATQLIVYLREKRAEHE